MNRQSLKQAQTCLDDALAAMTYCLGQGITPTSAMVDVWRSGIDTARTELLEFESSLSPSYSIDMRGVAYGTTGE